MGPNGANGGYWGRLSAQSALIFAGRTAWFLAFAVAVFASTCRPTIVAGPTAPAPMRPPAGDPVDFFLPGSAGSGAHS